MAVDFTPEQQKVIDLRKRNILVSAAAGSGKTAVLVERIITMLTKDENPIDIDELLIVTYTEAAAAEMKERIQSAIEKALEEVDGAYPAINQAFAAYLREKYPDLLYLDREDDMGLPGLRKAKLSYNPHHLVTKFWARLWEEDDEG